MQHPVADPRPAGVQADKAARQLAQPTLQQRGHTGTDYGRVCCTTQLCARFAAAESIGVSCVLALGLCFGGQGGSRNAMCAEQAYLQVARVLVPQQQQHLLPVCCIKVLQVLVQVCHLDLQLMLLLRRVRAQEPCHGCSTEAANVAAPQHICGRWGFSGPSAAHSLQEQSDLHCDPNPTPTNSTSKA